MILTLDLGTKTGWAISDGGKIHASGTENFKGNRFDGGGMRFLRFRRWLDEIGKGVTMIAYEEVRRHLGVDAAHAYGGYMGTLTAWCEENAVPCYGVPVGTIKKHITGIGNAGKNQVIESLRKLGHNPKDDNEADAIALCLYAHECL